jgi:lipopolysaccharide assembly protein A
VAAEAQAPASAAAASSAAASAPRDGKPVPYNVVGPKV